MSPLEDDPVEDRLRAELGPRPDVGSAQWRVSRSQVRQEAARRRIRGATVSAVFVSACTAAALTAAVALPRDRADQSSATPRSTATTTVRVPVTLEQMRAARAVVVTLDSTWEPWFAVPLRSGSAAVLYRQARSYGTPGGVNVVALQVRDGRVQGGRVEGAYGAPERHVVAVPVPDGDGTSMVVVAPEGAGAQEVLVTSSTPREPSPQVSRAPIVDGVAVVPVLGPMWVTAVGIRARDGSVATAIPARSFGPEVPARLDRVVVSAGPPGSPQLAQVRTDGTTACRMTVAGFSASDRKAVPWNPFDAACAHIDGSLQPLLAADRLYSSVAGVAPQGTARVRLHWRDRTTNTVPAAAGGVPAFIDTAYAFDGTHRASDLVRLEALDRPGGIVAKVVPPPGDPTRYGS